VLLGEGIRLFDGLHGEGLSKPCRRTAPRWRLCQGHDALQRVLVARFPPKAFGLDEDKPDALEGGLTPCTDAVLFGEPIGTRTDLHLGDRAESDRPPDGDGIGG
jgi:hypothetical protein